MTLSISVVSLCLYQGWGQVIIWLFVATSRFNGAYLLKFGFEKVLELKESIFKLILKPQDPNQPNYKEQIFSTLASRRKNCLLLHLNLPKVTFPQSADEKINRKNKTLPGQGSNSLSPDEMSTALPTELKWLLVQGCNL